MIQLAALTLLCISSLSYGFVLQTPHQPVIIRNTRGAFATVCAVDVKETKHIKTGRPQITKISSAEEYLDFLVEDDRLCMVK
jgi:hypothetical protein